MEMTVAESIALQALQYLLDDDKRKQTFLAVTGLDAVALAEGTTDQHFLAGILDYLLASENLLLDFCEQTALPPNLPGQARNTLGGESYFG